MRVRLDCAILNFDHTACSDHLPTEILANGRLHLHRLPGLRALGDHQALASMALLLQRYDACVLVIRETDLAWMRQALLAARVTLRTPVIGLVHGLKAPAINDLYNSGMADFVRGPLCPEELRVRIERLVTAPGRDRALQYPVMQAPATIGVAESAVGPGARSACTMHNQPALDHGDHELEAFAAASASHCACSSDSFGEAKGKVIERFERAYLLASLAKSSGNIAMAARAAKKHRRAYWALMRKHDIDAAPFRDRCTQIYNPQDG